VSDVAFALADCERVRDGLWAQPANALSSLAYVVAGVGLIRSGWSGPDGARGWLRAFGLATAANGLGGVAYHGLGGPGSRWVHDAALLTTLGLMIARDGERPARSAGWHRGAPGLATAAGLLALSPRISGVAQLGTAAALVIAEALWAAGVRPRRTGGRARHLGIPALIVVPAVAVYALSRTGAPLCRPDSLLQGHALWHVLTAAALWWWGRTDRG